MQCTRVAARRAAVAVGRRSMRTTVRASLATYARRASTTQYMPNSRYSCFAASIALLYALAPHIFPQVQFCVKYTVGFVLNPGK